MKKIYKLLAIFGAVVLIATTACEKQLDFAPTTEINSALALTSTEGLQTALLGTYERMTGGDLYGGHIWGSGDMLAYNVIKSNEYALVYEEIQMMNKGMSPDNRISSSMWTNGYWALNMANTLLEAIPEVNDEFIDDNKDRIRGECLFIRAIMHFDMMRYFMNVNTGEGIPLLTKTLTIDDQPARAPIESIYEQVIADLQEAASLLPESNDNRATMYSAKALLARVYFSHKDYDLAAATATEVIESEKFSLVQDDLTGIYQNYPSSETIFGLLTAEGSAITGTLQGFYRKDTIEGTVPKFVFPNRLIKIFTQTSGSSTLDDERYLQLAMNYKGKVYCIKYNYRFMHIPVIRLAEMYLIRAECVIGTNVSQAREDMNMIRERAGLKTYPYENAGGITVDVSMNEIFYERTKELFYEGDDFFNRRRLERSFQDPNPNSSIEYEWNASEIMFKIPQREIDVNPNLTQN
jgi:hypothetical protein